MRALYRSCLLLIACEDYSQTPLAERRLDEIRHIILLSFRHEPCDGEPRGFHLFVEAEVLLDLGRDANAEIRTVSSIDSRNTPSLDTHKHVFLIVEVEFLLKCHACIVRTTPGKH